MLQYSVILSVQLIKSCDQNFTCSNSEYLLCRNQTAEIAKRNFTYYLLQCNLPLVVSSKVRPSNFQISIQTSNITVFRNIFKVFLVDGSDEEVENRGDTDEAGHGVHGVVVEEGRGVDCALRHDGHQFGDGESLGLYQALSGAQLCTELGRESLRIHLGKKVSERLWKVSEMEKNKIIHIFCVFCIFKVKKL